MLWKRRDMGSDIMNPIFVTTDLPVVDNCIEVKIPIDAYKQLAQWCSMGRTIDSAISKNEIGLEELEILQPALEQIHNAIRQHCIALPAKSFTDKNGNVLPIK